MRRIVLFCLFPLLAACGGPIVAISTESHEFTLTETSKVVVRTYDGRITVATGAEGKVSAEVKKLAHGWSESAATKDLGNVVVTFEQDGPTVTITAKARSGIADTGADVTVTVPAASPLDLATSNGEISTTGTAGEIVAATSNGKVQLSGGQGSLQATSSNGAIVITPGAAALVKASTSNGAISFGGPLLAGLSTFETSNGSIDVRLPADATFHLDAVTSNGSVGCEFPFTTTGTSGTELHADIGSDTSVKVQAHTSNGDVHIRKM